MKQIKLYLKDLQIPFQEQEDSTTINIKEGQFIIRERGEHNSCNKYSIHKINRKDGTEKPLCYSNAIWSITNTIDKLLR